MKTTILEKVSRTALGVAAKRAVEQERPDRLFDDPYAARLAGDELSALLRQWEGLGRDLVQVKAKRTRFVAVRTRIFDDFLMQSNCNARQVVILGAGMDARAYRLNWLPDTHVYEVDRPEIFQYKDAILEDLKPCCQRHVIPCDLADNWVSLLLGEGYQVDRPSIWLLEGLLMYFLEPEAHTLLRSISNLTTTGSYVGVDLVSLKSLEADGERVRQHWRFGTDEPEKLLASYGWDAKVLQPGEEGANFGRYTEPPPERNIPGQRRVFISTASRIA